MAKAARGANPAAAQNPAYNSRRLSLFNHNLTLIVMVLSKQTKRLILLFFISLVLDIALSPLRGYASFMVSSIISFIAFFLLVWFYCRRWKDVKPWRILLAVLLGWCVINWPVRIFSFQSSLVSFPDAWMHVLGMLSGYLFYVGGRVWKWVVVACGVALCVMITPMYRAWLHYLSFGTVSGRVETVPVSPLTVIAEDGAEFNIGGDGTIYVLDFWTTSCGICFREFPGFKEFADKYSGREEIRFYAVGIPWREETHEDIFRVFRMRSGIDIPVVAAVDMGFDGNDFGISSVPTIVVIDAAGRIVYRGNVEGAEKMVGRILK